MIYDENNKFIEDNPNKNILDVFHYMVGGLIAMPICVCIVAITKKYKPILMFLILIVITGLVIFDFALYQSVEYGNKLITIAMYLTGIGSLTFYGICFEFLVTLTDRKG